MKKILFAITAITLIGTACNKNKTHTVATPTKTTTQPQLPENEITYRPTSVQEGHKQTMDFLSYTKYGKANKRSNFPNIDKQVAGWLFESASNYLENSNDVFINNTHSYTIDITKVDATTIDGVDLTNEFNTFMYQIQHTTGETPQLINVYFWGEQSDKLTFKIDVYNGDDPRQTVVFPTTDQPYCDAIQNWLNPAMYEYIHQQYQIHSQQCQCAYYWNSITNASLNYGFATQGDGFYEYKLWISSIANNGVLNGLFKASDFPVYFQKYQDIANHTFSGPSTVYDKGLIHMSFECIDIPVNNNPWGFANYFPGYQHVIDANLFGSYIPVQNQ